MILGQSEDIVIYYILNTAKYIYVLTTDCILQNIIYHASQENLDQLRLT